MENKKQEFLEITTIGKRIGLQTLGDYKLFAEKERQLNETMLQALKRYSMQLEGGVQYGV